MEKTSSWLFLLLLAYIFSVLVGCTISKFTSPGGRAWSWEEGEKRYLRIEIELTDNDLEFFPGDHWIVKLEKAGTPIADKPSGD